MCDFPTTILHPPKEISFTEDQNLGWNLQRFSSKVSSGCHVIPSIQGSGENHSRPRARYGAVASWFVVASDMKGSAARGEHLWVVGADRLSRNSLVLAVEGPRQTEAGRGGAAARAPCWQAPGWMTNRTGAGRYSESTSSHERRRGDSRASIRKMGNKVISGRRMKMEHASGKSNTSAFGEASIDGFEAISDDGRGRGGADSAGISVGWSQRRRVLADKAQYDLFTSSNFWIISCNSADPTKE